MSDQQTLQFPSRGGRRRGAGRPPTRKRPGVPHAVRERVNPHLPVHVTLRMAPHVWSLRSERSYAIVRQALEAARRRADASVVHFAIQGNHIHLIVEARGARALGNAIRSFSIRLARRLNRMMGRSGPVFEDRYHAHVLRTPGEVRNALRYVLGNFARHAAAWGGRIPEGWVDPFSSAGVKVPREAQGWLFPQPATSPAASWLLRRHGPSFPTRGCRTSRGGG
ncbi:MAG TPA: transposase [Anaeromyxobacteraceae bacterium]|nr:transposase [Anaeromyxobacteraceae bacterium]